MAEPILIPRASSTEAAPHRRGDERPVRRLILVSGALLLAGLALYGGLRSGAFEALLSTYAQANLELMQQQAGGSLTLPPVEYLIMPADDPTPDSTRRFLERHPEVTFLRNGDFGQTLIVNITTPGDDAIQALRRDEFVSFILNTRLGVFCH